MGNSKNEFTIKDFDYLFVNYSSWISLLKIIKI